MFSPVFRLIGLCLLSVFFLLSLSSCPPPTTDCLTVGGQQRAAACEFVVEKLTITGADPVLTNVPRMSKKGLTLNPNQAQEGEVIPTPKFPLRWFTFTLNLTLRRVATATKATEQYAVLMRYYPKGQNISSTWGDVGTGQSGVLKGQYTVATPVLTMNVGESQTIQVPMKIGMTQAGSEFKDPNSGNFVYGSLDMSLFLVNPATGQFLTKNYSDMRDLSEWSMETNLVSFRR